MPRNDTHQYMIDLILVLFGLTGLLSLAIWVALPLWVTGIGALVLIVIFCGMLVWWYQPDIKIDAHFVTDGLDDTPELSELAQAARETT